MQGGVAEIGDFFLCVSRKATSDEVISVYLAHTNI